MALWYATGFDEFTNPSTYYLAPANGLVSGSSTSWSIATTGGRAGGAALTNSIGGGNERFAIWPRWNGRQGTCGFAYKFSQGGKGTIIAKWIATYPDGTIKDVIKLGMDNNNILYIDGGDFGIVKGTTPLLAGRFYYLEWKAQTSAVTGTVVDVPAPPSQPGSPPFTFYSAHFSYGTVAAHLNQVRVNGILEIDGGAGTWGYTFAGAYVFPRSPTLGNNSNIPYNMVLGDLWLMYDQFQLQNWFDDFYFLNNDGQPNSDFLGDVSVQFLQATTGGTPSTGNDQWTLAAGSSKNVAVREFEPDGDATYISAVSSALRQTFKFGSIRTGAIVTPGIIATAVTRKSDLGNRGFKWLYSDGAGSIPGVLDTFRFLYRDKYTLFTFGMDTPNGGGSWTESKIDAFEGGVIEDDPPSGNITFVNPSYQDGFGNGQIPDQ